MSRPGKPFLTVPSSAAIGLLRSVFLGALVAASGASWHLLYIVRHDVSPAYAASSPARS